MPKNKTQVLRTEGQGASLVIASSEGGGFTVALASRLSLKLFA